jgi:spore coat polysaccharide biosynthesis predicted glycosyltransferase SpsG
MTVKLFFYTDASHSVGLGHFMRCFALAEQAIQCGLHSHFFLNEITLELTKRLESINATWVIANVDLEEYCIHYPSARQNWWVVDSYKASADFISKLRKKSKVLVLDDLCALGLYDCDLIVNASPSSRLLGYEGKSINARLLVGPKFSLIRSEFRKVRQRPSKLRSGVIGIMIGGSDTLGLTGPILKTLHSSLSEYKFLVIMGESAHNKKSIQELSHKLDRIDLKISPPDLAVKLDKPDLVVTAAGGTIGELCAIGQMAVVLVVADNQLGALTDCPYPTLDCRNGLSVDLESTVIKALANSNENMQVRQNAQVLVDGDGCERILEEMLRC